MPALSDDFILNIDDGWNERLPASAFGQERSVAADRFRLQRPQSRRTARSSARMPSSQHPPSHLDFRFATSVANAYFGLARPLLDRLAAGLEEGAHAATDAASVFSVATNVALALELYLKAIRIGLKMTSPDTHNLWALYKSLPNEVKTKLEAGYDARVAELLPTQQFDLNICVQRGGSPSDPFEFPTREARSKLLPALIKRSAFMFVAWRYVHESVPPTQKHAFFSFEHSHLRIACETLLAFLQQGEQEAMQAAALGSAST